MNTDQITEITCISKKSTPAILQKAMQDLLSLGAADVFFPISVNSRHIISVLCKSALEPAVRKYFIETFPNAGVYAQNCTRAVLDRHIVTEETAYGPVRRKNVSGYGISRSKLEYDDLAVIAKQLDISIPDLKKQI